MSDHTCRRCGSKSSIFWWRHSLNCDFAGNEGTVFEICDKCMVDLIEFLRGVPIDNERNVRLRRGKKEDEE